MCSYSDGNFLIKYDTDAYETVSYKYFQDIQNYLVYTQSQDGGDEETVDLDDGNYPTYNYETENFDNDGTISDDRKEEMIDFKNDSIDRIEEMGIDVSSLFSLMKDKTVDYLYNYK